MLDEKEIRRRLKHVNRQLCVGFVARNSLRMLPFLAVGNSAFLYWDKEDRPKYVLALLRAQQVSFSFFSFGRKINITVDAAASAKVYAKHNIDLLTELQSDLDYITSTPSPSITDFITAPLWSQPITQGERVLIEQIYF